MDHNVMGYKWIFRVKRHPNGNVDRVKAWLVTKGFTQCPGLDYKDIFNPIVKPTTLQIVLSITVIPG